MLVSPASVVKYCSVSANSRDLFRTYYTLDTILSPQRNTEAPLFVKSTMDH